VPDRGRRRAVRRTSGRGAAGDRVSESGGRRRLALEFPVDGDMSDPGIRWGAAGRALHLPGPGLA